MTSYIDTVSTWPMLHMSNSIFVPGPILYIILVMFYGIKGGKYIIMNHMYVTGIIYIHVHSI